MSNEVRIDVMGITGHQSVESQTSIDNHVVAEDEKLLNELNKVEIKTGDLTHEEKPQTKIQRVPQIMLRYNDFVSYYKPRFVSIGPIHAKRSKLQRRELKIKLAAYFVKRSGKTGGHLLGKIKAKVGELRGCFGERVIKRRCDDESLSRLLFLDGCFLLQFLESYFSDSLKDFKITNGQAALISNDLLLAENQIPFLVLRLLMDSCDDDIRGTLWNNVLIFVAMNVPIGYPKYPRDLVDLFGMMENHALNMMECSYLDDVMNPLKLHNQRDWVHLLDVLREVQLLGDRFISKNKGKRDNDQSISKNKDEGESVSHRSFFPRFRRNNALILPKANRTGELPLSMKRSFRNVQELKLAGINLRPSRFCSLKGISFSTKWFIAGQLEMPTFVVDNSTATKLLNLVAYEMCRPDYETNCTVTSYVNFLDLLIDSEQDVKDLRAAHILRNHLSSDAEVAKLINSIGNSCLKAPKDSYLNVKNEIQRHYERKTAIWVAQVYNNHFKSPWTIIALLAASIGLILTAVQTWYAVHPK